VPGLADTRRIQQDELYKESLVKQIKKHVGSVTAVLVLANGTVPRITPSTRAVLSALTALVPTSLANNTAFVLTNLSSPLYQNLSTETIPDVRKDAPQFLLNNPFALQRRYLEVKFGPQMKEGRTDWGEVVKADERTALQMLADLFDWLDSLKGGPEIAPLYEKSQNITNTPEQAADKEAQDSAAFTRLATSRAQFLSFFRIISHLISLWTRITNARD
jgi:hypothetical protein